MHNIENFPFSMYLGVTVIAYYMRYIPFTQSFNDESFLFR